MPAAAMVSRATVSTGAIRSPPAIREPVTTTSSTRDASWAWAAAAVASQAIEAVVIKKLRCVIGYSPAIGSGFYPALRFCESLILQFCTFSLRQDIVRH